MRSTLRIFSALLVISLLILSSCGDDKKTESSLAEGVIEYKATVMDKTHPMAALAPGSATVKFKENRFELEMSTMGIFNTTFMSDPSKRTLIQMVKFMDLKTACIQDEADLAAENNNYKLIFTETQEFKKIAGYTCKKVKATMAGDPSVSFDVYYTEELGNDSINHLSPYREIKGMLMQYRLKKLGLEISFTATAVKKEEIGDETFQIPASYKVVTRSEMERLFSDIQK